MPKFPYVDVTNFPLPPDVPWIIMQPNDTPKTLNDIYQMGLQTSGAIFAGINGQPGNPPLAMRVMGLTVAFVNGVSDGRN